MFNPSSVLPFVKDVPHYYTDASFEPPARLEAPTPPQDWVSFNLLDATGPDTFEAFKNSPRFEQVHQQFLERIEQCKSFARDHCTAEDAQQIRQGFETFRRHLNENGGETFFGDVLPQLYGPSKRAFDRFCLRLEQDLDLHQRKTALRELASQIFNCRAGGPAFKDAALALDRAPGGLKGEFHDLLMQRIDALLKEVACRPYGQTLEESLTQQAWLEDMEVHIIDRLKMELGLPNGGDLDRFVHAPNLVRPEQVAQARQLLLEALRPVTLAKELAERYIIALRSQLPAELLEPGVDLNDHMPAIAQAHRQLGATYGSVNLHHLLTIDDETNEVHWQRDPSMLTHQLLEELARQGLIVEPPNGSLLRAYADGNIWDLRHVDWQLFVVAERRCTGAAEVIRPVQMRHAVELVRRVPDFPPRRALTEPVLTDTPIELQQFPPYWLIDPRTCEDLCRSLGDQRMRTWTAGVPQHLRDKSAELLLPVLTDLGMTESLRNVMQWSSCETTARQAGLSKILRRALEQTSPSVQKLWLEALERAIARLTPEEARSLFVPVDGDLIHHALLTATPGNIDRLLKVLMAVHYQFGFTPETLEKLLRTQLQILLVQGRADALVPYGSCLTALAKQQALVSPAAFRLLGGGTSLGCSNALRSGQVTVVEWFDHLVLDLFRLYLLDYRQTAELLRSTPDGHGSGAFEALQNKCEPAFSAHLGHLLKAVAMKVFFRSELPELLACRDPQGRPGLITMLKEPGPHPCLAPWVRRLEQAAQRNWLTAHDLMTLLAARDTNGTHLLLNLFAVSQGARQAQYWLEHVHQLQQAGVLEPHAMVALLDGYPRHPANHESSILLDLMHADCQPEDVTQLLELLGFAHTHCQLSPAHLARLLIPIQSLQSEFSIRALARVSALDRHVRALLEGLMKLGQEGHLDGDPLLRLLHDIARLCLSPLTVELATQIRQLIVALLQTDLATSDERRIRASVWGDLLVHFGGPATREARTSEDAGIGARIGASIEARADGHSDTRADALSDAQAKAHEILHSLQGTVRLALALGQLESEEAMRYRRKIESLLHALGLPERPPLPPKPILPRANPAQVAGARDGSGLASVVGSVAGAVTAAGAAAVAAQSDQPPPLPPRPLRRRHLSIGSNGGWSVTAERSAGPSAGPPADPTAGPSPRDDTRP